MDQSTYELFIKPRLEFVRATARETFGEIPFGATKLSSGETLIKSKAGLFLRPERYGSVFNSFTVFSSGTGGFSFFATSTYMSPLRYPRIEHSAPSTELIIQRSPKFNDLAFLEELIEVVNSLRSPDDPVPPPIVRSPLFRILVEPTKRVGFYGRIRPKPFKSSYAKIASKIITSSLTGKKSILELSEAQKARLFALFIRTLIKTWGRLQERYERGQMRTSSRIPRNNPSLVKNHPKYGDILSFLHYSGVFSSALNDATCSDPELREFIAEFIADAPRFLEDWEPDSREVVSFSPGLIGYLSRHGLVLDDFFRNIEEYS